MRESDIQNAVRSALNRDGRVRLLRNSVGVHVCVCKQCGFRDKFAIRFGMGVGSPDLLGIIRGGRVFGQEVKVPGRGLDPEQEAWWAAARKWGVLGGVTHSVEESRIHLEQAIADDNG